MVNQRRNKSTLANEESIGKWLNFGHALNKCVFLTIFFFLLGTVFSNAQWSIKGETTDIDAPWYLLQKFKSEKWEASNFASEQDMEWFTNARYGMFIHFGLSAYKEKDLSWGIVETAKAPDISSGSYPDSVWTKWPEKLVFENFDAYRWVEIARKAGMKYIVVIAKHHDGFHLWNTEYSDFNIMNTPFGRDYLKELADACHEQGIKFGIYYSQRDWYHPHYAPVDTSLIDIIKAPPYYKAKDGVEKVRPGQVLLIKSTLTTSSTYYGSFAPTMERLIFYG